MAKGLGSATFEIDVRLDALRSDMRRARKIVSKGAKKMGGEFESAGKNIGKFGSTLTKLTGGALASAGGAFATATHMAGQYADGLLDARDATGLSLEALQKWERVAVEAGVASDTAQQGVKELNNIAFRSERGLKRANYALGQIGVSMEEIKGASAKEKLELVNEGLRGIKDESRRAQLAQILYSGTAKDMLPILGMQKKTVDKLKKKHEEMGLVLSEKQVDALNKVDKQTGRAMKTFQKMGLAIMAELAPVISKLITFLQEKAEPVIKKIVNRAKEFAQKLQGMSEEAILAKAKTAGLIALIGPAIAIFGKLIQVVGFVMQNFNKLKMVFKLSRIAMMSTIGIVILVIMALIKLWKENEQFRKNVKAIWHDLKLMFSIVMPIIMKIVTGAFKFIMSIVVPLVSAIVAFIAGDWETLKKNLKQIVDRITSQIVKGFKKFWSLVKDPLKKFTGKVINWFDDLPDDMKDIALDVIMSFGGGLVSAIPNLKDKVKQVVSAVADWFPGSEPKEISSPLRGLSERGMESAKLFTKGMRKGMKAEAPELRRALGNISSTLSPSLAVNGSQAVERPNVNITNNNMMYEDQVTRAVTRALQNYSVQFGVE